MPDEPTTEPTEPAELTLEILDAHLREIYAQVGFPMTHRFRLWSFNRDGTIEEHSIGFEEREADPGKG